MAFFLFCIFAKLTSFDYKAWLNAGIQASALVPYFTESFSFDETMVAVSVACTLQLSAHSHHPPANASNESPPEYEIYMTLQYKRAYIQDITVPRAGSERSFTGSNSTGRPAQPVNKEHNNSNNSE